MSLAAFAVPSIHPPTDFQSNFQMFWRWVHFLAGITWIGLLYFFNLVNGPFMKELDPVTKGKVFPPLMLRALWWFRVSAVITVIAGLAYYGTIVGADARNASTSGGPVFASFFIIWTIVWAILYAVLLPGKGALDKGPVIGVIYAIVVAAAAYLFLSLNDRGWESNRTLAIGIGGGIGWVMMLNVWGVIWRIQKRLIQWTKENAEHGTAIPDQAKRMTRIAFLTSRANAYLSIVLLFFMGAASHYPMFGR